LGKSGQIWEKSDQDFGKFDQLWAKLKSCIPNNIRYPTAMVIKMINYSLC